MRFCERNFEEIKIRRLHRFGFEAGRALELKTRLAGAGLISALAMGYFVMIDRQPSCNVERSKRFRSSLAQTASTPNLRNLCNLRI